jgi:mono/diheme cytochrome c family protein
MGQEAIRIITNRLAASLLAACQAYQHRFLIGANMAPLSNRWTLLALGISLSGPLWASDGNNSYAGPAPDTATLASGEQIGRQVCSVCHAVAGDQEFSPRLRTPTPSFSEIANRPATTVKSLQKFITATHWDGKTIPISMPDPMLIPDQVLAVSRYIVSLRKP